MFSVIPKTSHGRPQKQHPAAGVQPGHIHPSKNSRSEPISNNNASNNMQSQLDWRCKQCFDERSPSEDPAEYALSAVAFDPTGDLIATGDRGGYITLYERAQGGGRSATSSRSASKGCEFRRHHRFRSHEEDFDYLKSLEIEGKINQIKFCGNSQARFLLSTNDKTIKLWKIHNKRPVVVSSNNLSGSRKHIPFGRDDLKIPVIDSRPVAPTASIRRTYGSAHAYIINSVSVNSDGETFLSADDLRVNLWNMEHQNLSFNVVDIKPTNMEDLTEVITAAEFHPSSCNLFMYSSSKGSIKLCDMRAKALCHQAAKSFEEEEDPANRNFFSEIIASVADAKFTRDGRYVVSRDYLTLKIWDVNMESKPVKTINVHEQLRSRLCELYESESIFDKFEVALSADGNNIVTGSYSNSFHIYDRYGKTDACIEISRANTSRPNTGGLKGMNFGHGRRTAAPVPDVPDYQRKVMNVAWSPTANTVAVAAGTQLYTFCA